MVAGKGREGKKKGTGQIGMGSDWERRQKIARKVQETDRRGDTEGDVLQ